MCNGLDILHESPHTRHMNSKDLNKIKKMLGPGPWPKTKMYEEYQLPQGTLFQFGQSVRNLLGASEEQAKWLFESQEHANVPKYGARPLKTQTTEDREADFWAGFYKETK